MITLITGVPGAGKTLYALNLAKARAEKESRVVYQNGVADCTLPWELLEDGEKWHADVPKGSIIVIDEAQRVFRPRGNGSAVPDYVSLLETHRHRGLDIILITQHPMLVDSNIRRLVGQHFHVVRRFGSHFATVHEWSSCTEISRSATEESVRHEFRYPAESFAWYKSAEVHTHKRRVPMRVYFIVLAPFLCAALGWFAYTRIAAYTDKRKAAEAIESVKAGTPLPARPRGEGPLSKGDYVAQFAPRVRGLAYTAPAYDKVTSISRAPVPSGCVASELRCSCFSQDGTRLDVQEALCREIVHSGFFVPFEVAGPQGANVRPSASGSPDGSLPGGGRSAPAPGAVPPAVPVKRSPVDSAGPSGAKGATGGVHEAKG